MVTAHDYGRGGFEEMTVNGIITAVRLQPLGNAKYTAVLFSTGDDISGVAASPDDVLKHFGRPVAITGLIFVDSTGEPLFIEQTDSIEPISVDLVDTDIPSRVFRLCEETP
jgi:hypothetical protein